MRKPLISVIITNYNYGKYIHKAIESVLNQTYKNIELIVVDDHSNDESDKKIRQILKNNLEVKYVRNDKNEGVVFSRNLGMKMSKGEFLCCLDADDYFNNDYIEINYNAISKYDADVIYTNWKFFGERVETVNFPEFDIDLLEKQRINIKPEALVRSSSIKNEDGSLKFMYLPETRRRANDWVFFIILAANGLKFKLEKNNYVNYFIKKGSMGNSLPRKEELELFCSYLLMLRKKYGNKIISPEEFLISEAIEQKAVAEERLKLIYANKRELKDKEIVISTMQKQLQNITNSHLYRIVSCLSKVKKI